MYVYKELNGTSRQGESSDGLLCVFSSTVDHLANHGPYSEADAARLIREVASALAFLHGLNVVHADLKPENRTSFLLFYHICHVGSTTKKK